MKIFATSSLVLFCVISTFAQVGVNTVEPTSTLDVNGTLRVRSMSESNEARAEKIVGVDENGNFIEIDPGRNLSIEDNILDSDDRTYTIDRDLNIFSGENIHNLVVFPGGPVTGKKIIRIRTANPLTNLTGIEAAADGTVINLYPTDGRLRLLSENAGSLPQNQILTNNTVVVQQNGVIQLFYDGNIQKWIVMSFN